MDDSTYSLQAISPIDGRYRSICSSLTPFFSESSLVFHRLLIEIRWFQFLSEQSQIKELPPLSKSANNFLEGILQRPYDEIAKEIKDIEATTNHDVKAVEYFLVNEFKQHEDLEPHTPFIHFGCTSEDINNTAYNLMIKGSIEKCISIELNTLVESMSNLSRDTNHNPMLSRTHGQPASPTSMGKEINVFIARLNPFINKLESAEFYTSKFSGAVGNYNAHYIAYPDIDWKKLSADFLNSLGLVQHECTTQIEPHDNLCHLLSNCCTINNILLDFSRDIWGYISIGYFSQRSIEEEVGSSTMPHKVNPINFENAEGNLGIANALFQHLSSKLPISRFQRDLSDSTTIRNIGVGFAHMLIALNNLVKGISKLKINDILIKEELENEWQILTEAIQTVMRKHGLQNAYDDIKKISRGNKVTQQALVTLIDSLNIPNEDKERLKALKPTTYLGNIKI